MSAYPSTIWCPTISALPRRSRKYTLCQFVRYCGNKLGEKTLADEWRHLDRQRWQAFESYNMVFYMLLYRVNGALDWICSLAFGAGTEHEFLLLYYKRVPT